MQSRFSSSAGATLLVAMLAVPAEKATTWRATSDVGSGLPWWTPIAVSGVLLMVSALYKFKHRSKPPEDITQMSQIDEMTSEPPPEDTNRTNSLRLLTE